MKKSVLKNSIIFLCLIILSGCSFKFYFNTYEDAYSQYLEEERKKEEEKEKKIKSRNYIDENMNPYFTLLNNEEKQVYYDILENANNYNKEIIELTYQLPLDNVHNAFLSVMYDNPELFWLKSYLYYTFENEDKIPEIVLKYYEDTEDLELMKNNLNNAVLEIVTEANKLSSNIEKEKYVHDILASKIEYDFSMKEDQRAYGALINNKSVCSGYAKAFQLVMRKLNIPTYYISGDITKDGDVGPHAWNMVKLENELYNVDLTWDDVIDQYGKNRIIYRYFNVNDDTMNQNHVRKDLSIKLPNALGGKYSNMYN